jgi:hypothetical protein
MALLVTAIGIPQKVTHERKDGSGSFNKNEIPFTLKAKFGETGGFQMGVNYTIWFDADKIAKVQLTAQSLIDGVAKAKSDGQMYHSSCRLAIVNDAECFEFGEIRTKTLKRKDGTEYSVTNQTIWLKDPTMVFQYDILELAVHPQRGNIDDLDVLVDVKGAELLAAPVASAAPTTAVDPF